MKREPGYVKKLRGLGFTVVKMKMSDPPAEGDRRCVVCGYHFTVPIDEPERTACPGRCCETCGANGWGNCTCGRYAHLQAEYKRTGMIPV